MSEPLFRWKVKVPRERVFPDEGKQIWLIVVIAAALLLYFGSTADLSSAHGRQGMMKLAGVLAIWLLLAKFLTGDAAGSYEYWFFEDNFVVFPVTYAYLLPSAAGIIARQRSLPRIIRLMTKNNIVREYSWIQRITPCEGGLYFHRGFPFYQSVRVLFPDDGGKTHEEFLSRMAGRLDFSED